MEKEPVVIKITEKDEIQKLEKLIKELVLEIEHLYHRRYFTNPDRPDNLNSQEFVWEFQFMLKKLYCSNYDCTVIWNMNVE